MHTQQKARELGITGWIKNNKDGSVSLAACGNKNRLDDFIEWINIGSPSSEVENVSIDWLEEGECKQGDFKIII